MCKVNFFEDKYIREVYKNDLEFGLCDDGSLAYSNISDQDSWIATVINNEKKDILFTPVDHNIIVKVDGDELSQCDGMLTLKEGHKLIFVELKIGQKGWIQEALEQLKSTICLFKKNHSIDIYSLRLAYAVNRRHPSFQYSKKNDMLEFKNETGFRLLIQANINI